MSESDSDFEMLEKRLSDLNPDELILVLDKAVYVSFATALCTPTSKLCCFRLPVPSLRCSTYTTYLRISAMRRVKELLVWER